MHDELSTEIENLVAHIRAVTDKPIAVGFGVSSGAQAKAAACSADAVVVGSALVAAARTGCLAELTRELREALG